MEYNHCLVSQLSGKSLQQVSEMTSTEYDKWLSFHIKKTQTNEKQDFYLASIAYQIYSVHYTLASFFGGKPKQLEFSDFLLYETEKVDKSNPEREKQEALQLALSMIQPSEDQVQKFTEQFLKDYEEGRKKLKNDK